MSRGYDFSQDELQEDHISVMRENLYDSKHPHEEYHNTKYIQVNEYHYI